MMLKGVPGVFGEKMRSEPLCQSCRNCEVPGKEPGAGVEAEEQCTEGRAKKCFCRQNAAKSLWCLVLEPCN